MKKELLVSRNKKVCEEWDNSGANRFSYTAEDCNENGIGEGIKAVIKGDYDVVYFDLFLSNSIGIGTTAALYKLLCSESEIILYESCSGDCEYLYFDQLDLLIKTLHACLDSDNMNISNTISKDASADGIGRIIFSEYLPWNHVSVEEVLMELPEYTQQFTVGDTVIFTKCNESHIGHISDIYTDRVQIVIDTNTTDPEVSYAVVYIKDIQNVEEINLLDACRPCIVRESYGDFEVKVIWKKIAVNGNVKYATYDGRVYSKDEIDILPESMHMVDTIVNETLYEADEDM